MTQAVTTFLAQLRSDLATMPGLDRCYQGVPDAINETPAIVVYPIAGNWSLDTHGRSDGTKTYLGVHTIRIELHVARKDLARDMSIVETFTDTLPVYIFDGFVTDRYQWTLLTVGDARLASNDTATMRYRIVEGAWGSDQHIGHQIEFDVSIQQEVVIP